MFPYSPGNPPDDPAKIARFLREELWSIKRGLESAGLRKLKKLTGTSGAAGSTTSVAHCIANYLKIIGCDVLLKDEQVGGEQPSMIADGTVAY